MADEKVFKELELGIRELFRIFIPGAYAITLIQLLVPHSGFSQLITEKTTSGLLAAFFLGLIGYALRVHERWFPFFLQFEKYRLVLKKEIDRIVGSTSKDDNVDVYKYFLATHADNVNDRVHYFSSFYYMLVELSLFSALAGLSIVACWLHELTEQTSHAAAVAGSVAIGAAVLIQLAIVFGLRSIKTERTKIVLWVELGFASLGLVVMMIPACQSGHLGLAEVKDLGWTPVALMAVAYLFWRLGDKHWEQIIREQCVLVNDKGKELLQSSRKFEPGGGTTGQV